MTLDQTRQKLVEELKELKARHDHIEAHLRNADRTVPQDSGERATFTQNDEVLEALDDSGRLRLAALTTAIERMDAGTWGACAECGKDIQTKRLDALPESTTCIRCAEAAEA